MLRAPFYFNRLVEASSVRSQFLLVPGVDEASSARGGAVMSFFPTQQEHLCWEGGFAGERPDLYRGVVKYMQLNQLAAERAG